ncbi:MAG: biotin--[acetyl-CoA-carboxylase] ligase [Candidatus Xenobia bacterium]
MKINWHESLSSTNEEAKRLAEEGAAEWTVVVADQQTAGRGRLGRVWCSPPGGLWFSLILRPSGQPPAGLSVLFAAACCRAIKQVAGVEARFNWPNDIVLLPHARKAGGVLLESRGSGWVVAGIGLNAAVAPEALAELGDIACSISDRDIRRPLLDAVLAELEAVWAQPDMQAAAALCYTVGRDVELELDAGTRRGRVQGLDASGALLLDSGDPVFSCVRCKVSGPVRE